MTRRSARGSGYGLERLNAGERESPVSYSFFKILASKNGGLTPAVLFPMNADPLAPRAFVILSRKRYTRLACYLCFG